MATVRYTNIEGQIVAEKRGGTRSTYVPDAIGSTVLLTNRDGVSGGYGYWPYGEVQVLSVGPETPFLFIGTFGVRRDIRRSYVRARTLESGFGRWLTSDPSALRSRSLNGYDYADSRPTSIADTTGLAPGDLGLPPGADWKSAFNTVTFWLKNNKGCRDEFAKVCSSPGATFASEVKDTLFSVDQEDCSTFFANHATSGCAVLPTVDARGRPGCTAPYLCFTKRAKDHPKSMACLLLLEMANKCNCNQHNKKDEVATQAVLDKCRVTQYCSTHLRHKQ
jgi:RHS repeat-associated protein